MCFFLFFLDSLALQPAAYHSPSVRLLQLWIWRAAIRSTPPGIPPGLCIFFFWPCEYYTGLFSCLNWYKFIINWIQIVDYVSSCISADCIMSFLKINLKHHITNISLHHCPHHWLPNRTICDSFISFPFFFWAEGGTFWCIAILHRDEELNSQEAIEKEDPENKDRLGISQWRDSRRLVAAGYV